jgi:uncharacterized RDD family membrane protein YckC
MKPLHLALVLIAAGTIVSAQQAAQAPPSPPATVAAPATTPAVTEPAAPDDHRGDQRSVVRIGQDLALGADETASNTVVIFGNATIEGKVDQDVVVILGSARIASTAMIDHDLVVIGGSVRVASGAHVGNDFVVVGGATEIAPDFAPGGEHVVIGPSVFGPGFGWLGAWLSRGFLWGRPLVPGLLWLWVIVGAFFLFYLAINQIIDGPVHGSAQTLIERPLTAFGAGLLVMLLFGPLCLLLAISVIGLAVIPFVICALFFAAVVGKVAVMRWMGMEMLGDDTIDSPRRVALAFTIGFVALTIAYLIPILGFATWGITSVLGLGAMTLTVMSSYRREQPAVAAFVPPLPPGGPARPLAPMPAATAATEPAGATAYQPAPSLASPQPQAAGLSPAMTDAVPPIPVPPAGLPPAMLGTLTRAELRNRLAAVGLDVVLVAFVVQLLSFDDGRALVLALLAYHVAFWGWKQTTVGGMICHLRIERIDGAPLTYGDAVVRALSAIFSAVALGLGFVAIRRDPERRAWHDRIAGTYVVKMPPSW